MNILIIPSWYPESPKDLYGSFFREQAIALSKAGHKVVVLNGAFVSFKKLFSKACTGATVYEDDGITVYRRMIPSFRYSRNTKLACAIYLKRIDYLFERFKKENPDTKIDIIHAHSCFPAGYAACVIGKKKNIPVVITEHRSNYLRDVISKGQQVLLRYCVENCEKFICVGNRLRHNISGITGADENSIAVIPNMVSPIFEIGERKKSPDKPFTFTSVGGLIPLKRHIQLVKCFHHAFSNKDDVRLCIIGEGPERSTLEEYITCNNLNDKIHLLGKKSRGEVAKYLQKGNAFVLTSSMETFGVVYIEAMACGLPVIASRNGGAEDIVTEKSGILVDVDNDRQLTEALVTMYENIKNYDSQQIAADVQRKYSEQSVTKQLSDIYSQACASKKQR